MQVGRKGLHEMHQALLAGECDGIIERNMHLEYLTVMHKGDNLVISDVLRDGPQAMAVQVKAGHQFPTIMNCSLSSAQSSNCTQQTEDRVQDKLAFWISRLSASGHLRALYGKYNTATSKSTTLPYLSPILHMQI